MKKNIAVVGCGNWGKNLIRNFAELDSLAAVCDPNEKLAQSYAAQYNVVNLSFSEVLNIFNNEHGFANSRARLRMATLYQAAAANSGIVVGTGNKVEDFGVGFYTKYGDGGVDISPIADCTKTQVWELGKHLGISEEIINKSIPAAVGPRLCWRIQLQDRKY